MENLKMKTKTTKKQIKKELKPATKTTEVKAVKPIEFEKEVALLKLHLHNKLWRKTPDQAQKWIALLNDFCKLYDIKVPELLVNANLGCHFIKARENSPATITLDKYSIISLLHEFAHYLSLSKDKDWTEKDIVHYSETIFLTAYPKANDYLVRDEFGGLVKKQESE